MWDVPWDWQLVMLCTVASNTYFKQGVMFMHRAVAASCCAFLDAEGRAVAELPDAGDGL